MKQITRFEIWTILMIAGTLVLLAILVNARGL